MATWLEINRAFIGKTIEQVSQRTGRSYRLTFVNIPKGVTLDGRDLSGATVAVFENQVKIRQRDGYDTDTRLVALDEDAVTLSVPVRDATGTVVTKADGKWLTERIEVPALALREALRENDRRWHAGHPASDAGRVRIETSDSFVSEPFDLVSKAGKPYQRVAVTLPRDVRVGGVDVGQASLYIFPSQVSARTRNGVDTGRRVVVLEGDEVELRVPDRDGEGRAVVGPDGRWVTHAVSVAPEDLRKALEESRDRWRAANRVVSPQGVRSATKAVLDGLADGDIPFPDEAQGIGPSL